MNSVWVGLSDHFTINSSGCEWTTQEKKPSWIFSVFTNTQRKIICLNWTETERAFNAISLQWTSSRASSSFSSHFAFYTANKMIVALIVTTKLLSVLLSSLENLHLCSFLANNYYHDSNGVQFRPKIALLSVLLSISEETPTNDFTSGYCTDSYIWGFHRPTAWVLCTQCAE